MQLAVANARKTLETGVTTVRDLGAGGGLDITLRDEIDGRPDDRPAHVRRRARAFPPAAAAARRIRPRCRRRPKRGSATRADWVKVYASRGSYQSVDTTQTIFFDELKAIVDTAHAKGPQGRDPFVRAPPA